MDYKGYEYSVVQTANPTGWKWTLALGPMRSRSGDSYSRQLAISLAIRAVETELRKIGEVTVNQR